MTERRAISITRYLGALALLAVGVDHIEQYYVDYYRAVPTIGTLFVLNFVSASVVALLLVAPLRRVAGSRSDRIATILAVGGIGIAASTLAGLLISENGGLFGFMEVGYRGAIVLSIAFDVAAMALLGAFVVLREQTSRRRYGVRLRAVARRGPGHRRAPTTKPQPRFDRRHGGRTRRQRKETTK